ncbi:MAG: hypothetical protein C0393_05645 [Anaerolinea sp.]|nr:hypothetical protein [Anaerolinea sp.]
MLARKCDTVKLKQNMKLLTITLKDLSQSLRSAFAVVFMFVLPILVTGMFYFMFGGQSEGDEPAFNLSQIQVQIVNLDEGSPAFAQNLSAAAPEQLTGMGIDLAGVHSMGDILAQMLESETFAGLLVVSEAADAASARAAVDSQQAGVAVIIPQDFTQALMASEEQAVIELYQDPALTLGPAIVKAILGSFLDNTAATRIGIEVVSAQLTDSGLSVDDAQRGQIAMQFLKNAAAEGQGSALVEVRPLAGTEPAANPLTSMIAMIMGGMMIFYAFYTGTATAESILREEERGTLPRLFTTPTPLWTILGGKFIASALMVTVQVSVLLVFGRLVFGIHWGEPLPVALAALGIVLSACSLGIFIISLLKNVKQTGAVFGGVLTITGMIGIFSVFTMNVPSAARITSTLSLIVPQGWAMRSLRLAMEGASLAEFMPIMAGILAWSAAFFTIGILRFRKRYA